MLIKKYNWWTVSGSLAPVSEADVPGSGQLEDHYSKLRWDIFLEGFDHTHGPGSSSKNH